MKPGETDHLFVTELLQARDAARLARTPAHFGLELTLKQAYDIGHELHERLVARGFKPIGRKIGFTNRALWEQFKVSEPIWAPMYDRTVHFAQEGHCRLSLAGMVAPRLEPEIVVKLRATVPSEKPSAEEVATCIEWAAVGFEIVDTHYANWSFTATEAVADFGLHAGLVVGTPWRMDSEAAQRIAAALETLRVTLSGGQNFVAQGEGRNALGNPLLAVGHLARVLSAQPWAPPLAAGEIITTGTLTALPYLHRGESYRVEVAGASLAPLHLEISE